MLLALLLLSTLAFLDFSLVALRLRGVLGFDHPVSLVATGLFFVSGPASWLTAARLGGREARLAALLLPVWGVVAALYAAVLSTVLESGLGALAEIAVLPAGLVVALIGFLEMMVDDELRSELRALYEKCSLGTPPYALLTLSSITAVLALVSKTLPALIVGILVYAAGVALYAACGGPRASLCHVYSVLVASMLSALLVAIASGGPLRAALAAVLTAAPLAAIVKSGGVERPCSLILLATGSAAVLAAGLASGASLETLGANLEVFLTVGAIGWSATLAALAAARLKPGLVARIASSREARMAAGLALIVVGARVLGLPESYVTLTLFLAGVAAGVLNESRRSQPRT